MKISSYKSYDELPLFLNAELMAKVPGVSPSSGYELMHEDGVIQTEVTETDQPQQREAETPD